MSDDFVRDLEEELVAAARFRAGRRGAASGSRALPPLRWAGAARRRDRGGDRGPRRIRAQPRR